ncbi:MAG: hypothetical protein RSD13_02690 [Clostridium sp.]|uniref:hypothetical protein n=1 Tax=Clostridium sp. TaxID=1506 RepID=UPI002FC58974
MRKVKIIIAWILVSVILQCTGLFFLDKFYFKDNTDVEMQQVSIHKTEEKPEVHVDIPSDATDVKVSYDGKYVTYNDGYEANMYDTSNGEIKTFSNSDDKQILKLTWLADRNKLLILERDGYDIALYNYDPDKGTNEKMVDICSYSSEYKTFDIKASTITGVTYVRVANMVYRVDINQSQAVAVPLVVRSLGSLALMPTKDRLVYMAKNGQVIHLTQPTERVALTTSQKLDILGVDSEGVAYIGEGNGKTVSKIIKKDLDNTDVKSTTITLSEPVNPKEIFIGENGEIFVNYESKHMVKEMKSGKETKYDGKFLAIYNKGVASLIDNKYYKTKFGK